MTDTEELKSYVHEKLHLAKGVTQVLSVASTEAKNGALQAMAESLFEHRQEIIEANAADIREAEAAGQGSERIDRLYLDEPRIVQMMDGLRQIAALPDPVGEVMDTLVRPNGLQIQQVRVPMGVIAMIYESRPNVTVDAAGLAIKTGNAAVLRGGREALRSNAALVRALCTGLQNSAVPDAAVQFISRVERESVDILIQARGLVDLAIPRGGTGLISRVVQSATVPVIETGVGNCHVYVDCAADLTKASRIVLNAKTQRPSVCNAMETLLVHEQIAAAWLPEMIPALVKRRVEIHGCDKTMAILAEAGYTSEAVREATEADWSTEFLRLVLAVKVVADLDEAMAHIAGFGTLHSEAIVTEDAQAAQTFLSHVDAAVVYHNASTRFTDGFEFGYGAEIGISTQKLHARGPMGLRELTSYKYVVRGDGQVRE